MEHFNVHVFKYFAFSMRQGRGSTPEVGSLGK